MAVPDAAENTATCIWTIWLAMASPWPVAPFALVLELHLSSVRELDGVANKIEEHLCEELLVAVVRW